MQVWLAKLHSRGEGPEVLLFRANLQDRILTLPREWNATANFTLEQVDIAYLVFADGLLEAIDQATAVIKFLEVPQAQAALAVVHVGDFPTPPSTAPMD